MTENDANPFHFTIEQISDAPRAFLLKGFLTPDECMQFIDMAEKSMAPSTAVDPETGEFIQFAARSSSGTYFMLGQTPLIVEIEDRIARLTDIPVVNGEGLQVLNYQIGQQYMPHFDFFDPALKVSAKPLACGGQRVATCLMYLYAAEEGGETHFPAVDLKVTPVAGDALIFYNLLPTGEVDRQSLHASLPVTQGEKWVATKWLRERPYVAS